MEVGKCEVFGQLGNLINRLIHRSWGEGFVNIFLDLSIYISHFSSSMFVEGFRENDSRASLQGCDPDTGATLGTRSWMEMDDRISDVSPWDVSQWTVVAIILRARNRRRMKTLMIMSCERLNERRHEIRRTETAERRTHRGSHTDPERNVHHRHHGAVLARSQSETGWKSGTSETR